jgi:hypothetical protein
MKVLVLLSMVLMVGPAVAQTGPVKNPYYKEVPNKKFVRDKITYIPLEGNLRFPNSAWGSIGWARQGLVYVMVCDHISDAEVYEYNTKTGKLCVLGKISDLLMLKSYAERVPKIHSQIYQDTKSGLLYFGTDAGDRSEGATFDHGDEGYWGGFLCTLNPVTKEVKNLGLVERHAGVKNILVDSDHGLVYMNTSRESYFYKYEISTGRFTNLGRVNGAEIPRTLFSDKWNNVYNCTESGYLVRYNLKKDTLEYLSTYWLGHNRGGVSQAAYGPNRDFIWAIDNYQANLMKYTPEENGPGRLDSITTFTSGKKAGARNLNYVDKKLCFILTGIEEAEAVSGDTTHASYLYVYDTEKMQIIKKVKVDDDIRLAYGHPISDAAGNCYTVGFFGGNPSKDGKAGKKAAVVLIQYNPKAL